MKKRIVNPKPEKLRSGTKLKCKYPTGTVFENYIYIVRDCYLYLARIGHRLYEYRQR